MKCPHCGGKLPTSGLEWKRKQRALGLCWHCAQPAVPGKTRCAACAAKEAAYARAKYGHKPKRATEIENQEEGQCSINGQ